MAIRCAQWNNHPSLGDLELDFMKSNGQAYRTIVIAGENGSGKTSILESFSKLGEDLYPQLYDFSCIEVDEPNIGYARVFQCGESDISMECAFFDAAGKDITNNFTKTQYSHDLAVGVLGRFRSRGIAYSRARSGFRTGSIKSITADERDWSKSRLDESDDYTPVKQMLVNLRTQDDREYVQLAMARKVVPWESFYPKSRVCRFASSFNAFFDGLTFDRVDQVGSYHQVVFQKHSRDIPIDTLSTGEKQIVYRGAYLLESLESNESGVVLVDEPELSMHPKWQRKILDYYRNLFPLEGDDPVQLIVATHSEYVLEAALQDRENTLVIALEDKDGAIVPRGINAPYALETLAASEIKYLVFGIVGADYHTALYGRLQALAPCDTVKSCDSFISQQVEFDESLHGRSGSYKSSSYVTLPTYIRNAIHHPESGNVFNDEDLALSIELMQSILLKQKC